MHPFSDGEKLVGIGLLSIGLIDALLVGVGFLELLAGEAAKHPILAALLAAT
jgi:hypothetical protein